MPEARPGPTSPLFVQSLEKGLQVLEAFQAHRAMTLPEIALAVDITKSSAQRMVHTLESIGYLMRDPALKRFRLTAKAVSLGYGFLAKEPLLQNAYSILHRLAQECGESVNFSIPDGDDMLFVMRIHSHRHIPVYMPTGTRIPMASSSSGRALLAALPPETAAERLATVSLQPHTARTTTSRKELRRLVDEARGAGYAYADEEFFTGDLNVAAAVLADGRLPVAAVNISVPKPRWTLERACEELAPLAMRAARAIGQH